MARAHIGIVGVSPEGSALCLRAISRAAGSRLGPEAQPRISLHNEPLPHYIEAIRENDWAAVAAFLRQSAERLAACGAQFCVTPDHAVQYAIDLAAHESPIPWLGMADLIGDAIERDGRQKVGLLGTRWVTAASTYQTRLGMRGIQVHAPGEQEAEELDKIIVGELIYGNVTDASREKVSSIVEGFGERGCDAVLLGSSEAPLILDEFESPIPIYDASEILAQGVIDRAIDASGTQSG